MGCSQPTCVASATDLTPDDRAGPALPPKIRFTSLDAMRGLAACAVVLWHCHLVLPEADRAQIDGTVWARLLQPLSNGDAAVVIFFTLSGYVLSLPYLRGTQLSYPRYLVRRLCRVYLPFLASILLALALYAVADHARVAGASVWFNELWPAAWPGAAVIAGHVLMIGTAPDMALNPPMWTLVYELRLSLIFPLLVLFCRRTVPAAFVSLLLLVGSIKLVGLTGQNAHPSFTTNGWATLLWTAHTVPFFATGILLSKHRAQIAAWLRRVPPVPRACLFALPYAVFCTMPGFGSAKGNIAYDLAAGLLIVLVIEAPRVRGLLDRAVPQWLGRVSYSLYLVHLPLMLATAPVLLGHMPFWTFTAVVMAMSLIAATVMHALVEVPAMRLGYRLTAGRRRLARLCPTPGAG